MSFLPHRFTETRARGNKEREERRVHGAERTGAEAAPSEPTAAPSKSTRDGGAGEGKVASGEASASGGRKCPGFSILLKGPGERRV